MLSTGMGERGASHRPPTRNFVDWDASTGNCLLRNVDWELQFHPHGLCLAIHPKLGGA